MSNRKSNDEHQDENKMFIKNQGLVIKVANDYKEKYRLAFNIVDDLVQEGNMALIRSIKKFDPQKGKLSTYAHYDIYFSMLKYLLKFVFPKAPPKDPLAKTYYGFFLKYFPNKYRNWINTLPQLDKIVIELIVGWCDGELHSRKYIQNELKISYEKISRIEAKRRREFLNILGINY